MEISGLRSIAEQKTLLQTFLTHHTDLQIVKHSTIFLNAGHPLGYFGLGTHTHPPPLIWKGPPAPHLTQMGTNERMESGRA